MSSLNRPGPSEKAGVFGLAEGRQPHYLVFVSLEHIEAEEVGDGAVKLTQRMGQVDAFEDFDTLPFAPRIEDGGGFPDTVHRQNGRAVKRRRKEGAGRVTHVVVDDPYAISKRCHRLRSDDSAQAAFNAMLAPFPARSPFSTSGSSVICRARPSSRRW